MTERFRGLNPLTGHRLMGTTQEGGECPQGTSRKKHRRAVGPAAVSLQDFIMRLHTFVRDWSEVAAECDFDVRGCRGLLDELACLLKEEYDIRHGK